MGIFTLTKDEEQDICQQYVQGVSPLKLCASFGISRTLVYSCLKRHAIAPFHRRKPIGEEEQQVLCEKYASGLSSLEIAKQHFMNKSVVIKCLHKHGILLRHPNRVADLTECDRIQICNLYNSGATCKSVAEELDISIAVVMRVLNIEGITIRHGRDARHLLDCDHNYFKSIDTEEKAYWLGFFAADGNVNKNRGWVSLRLAEKDLNHLVRFRSTLGSEHKILHCQHKGKKSVVLCISSPQLIEDLEHHGIVPRKSRKTIHPQVAPHLFRHLIRGWFDGDGWVSVIRKSLVFGICGKDENMKMIGEVLVTESCINHSGICYQHGTNWFAKLERGGNIQGFRFARYIYEGSTICLERKRNVFIQQALHDRVCQRYDAKFNFRNWLYSSTTRSNS